MNPVPLPEKCKQLAQLKELKEYHESLAELAGARYATLAKEVYIEMAEQDVPNMRISGDCFGDKKARSISPAIKISPSVVNEADFYLWLKKNNEAGIIRPEYVFPKSIEALCKRRKEANLVLPPKEILTVYEIETANVRRV